MNMLDIIAAKYLAPFHRNNAVHQLSIKIGTHLKLVETPNIVCVQAAGNYVGIVMVTGEVLHTKETISHIVERLPNDLFIRIHRSYVVNIRHIREIRSKQNHYEFTLVNDARLFSGTTYRKSIRKQFSINHGHGDTTSASQLAPNAATGRTVFDGYKPEVFPNVRTHIRVCNPGDEPMLAFLGKIAFIETYTGKLDHEDILAHTIKHDAIAAYQSWLEDPAVRVWMLETEPGNVPVGYLVLGPVIMPFTEAHSADLEIHRIYVLKSFQTYGLGKQLISKAVQHAKQCGCSRLLLGDYHANHPAIAFYQRLGFCSIGEYLCRTVNNDYHGIVFSLEIR